MQRRASRWAIRNNIPIAYISDSENRQERNCLKELLKYPLLRWYFSKINYFLTVGNANESFYRYYGVPSDKLIRMHFPIDIKYYKSSFDRMSDLREEIRKEYEISVDDFVICVVGKLVAWKNQDHIIDAMYLLEQRQQYMHLFILTGTI